MIRNVLGKVAFLDYEFCGYSYEAYDIARNMEDRSHLLYLSE